MKSHTKLSIGVKYRVPNLSPTLTYTDYTTYDSKEEFELDGVGNRIRVIDGITTTYTTNNLNQYTQISSTNLTYDLNGNLTDDGVNTYIYDYSNRLLKVTRKSDSQVLGEYKYDTLGRRIYKKAWNGEAFVETYFYYDGVRCIEERNSSDSVIATYVFGNGIDEVLTMERNSQTYYYHENSLGSIYAVTTSTGNVAERYTYDAYGNPSFYDASGTPITNSLIANHLLFTGREYDIETGLYYYRARYYSTELGRFLQRDVMQDDFLLNLYAYVNNNPINNNDPYGQWTDKEYADKIFEIHQKRDQLGVDRDFNKLFQEMLKYLKEMKGWECDAEDQLENLLDAMTGFFAYGQIKGNWLWGFTEPSNNPGFVAYDAYETAGPGWSNIAGHIVVGAGFGSNWAILYAKLAANSKERNDSEYNVADWAYTMAGAYFGNWIEGLSDQKASSLIKEWTEKGFNITNYIPKLNDFETKYRWNEENKRYEDENHNDVTNEIEKKKEASIKEIERKYKSYAK